MDNGDILQGQPISYYYNYVAPEKTNIAASVLNYMGYDAATVGNHDIEQGIVSMTSGLKNYASLFLVQISSILERTNLTFFLIQASKRRTD